MVLVRHLKDSEDDAEAIRRFSEQAFQAPRNWRRQCLFVSDTAWHPPLDVYETETQILIKVELAGIVVEDVEVTVDKDILTIAGFRPDPAGEGEGVRCVHHREIDSGRFERHVRLPARIDRSSIAASLKNGFLEIVMNKDQKRPRQYKVQVS